MQQHITEIEQVAAAISEDFPTCSLRLLQAATELEKLVEKDNAEILSRLSLSEHWSEHN